MSQSPRNGQPGPSGMPPQAGTGAARPGEGEPGWASGLRKLYNSVVDEPLPDSFKDLLKKLDGSDDD
ncbi:MULTISPECIES: NepR family anti-sigma factor [Sphingomonadaceae]|uniref:NepR family anti-sigma factor n=1 Tax=Sphingomonadaceae TaxID=41297 RepID=UPI00115BBDC3|nr:MULTISPECIES: NepR family anti-sigma factor [Sphingomonadaceae]